MLCSNDEGNICWFGFASEGADLAIWLLFGFVVLFHLDKISKCFFLIVLSFNHPMRTESLFVCYLGSGRQQSWYLQQQKGIGGIFINLTIIQTNACNYPI